MKKRLFPSILFILAVIMLTSCYSSRRSRTGCPANPQSMNHHVQQPVVNA